MSVKLRDMLESDIKRYVRWMTVEDDNIDWNKYDAPWEAVETDEETERKSWREYYERIKTLPEERLRWKFEIEADGEHIGWVSAYDDLGYIENPEGIIAIGIDIPERRHRKKGYGEEALRQFMNYLKEHGARSLFTQTWSGNIPMIRLAEKLGFKEYARVKDLREVNGEKYDAVTFRVDFAE